MNSPEKDKAFFEAGIRELEPYLLSKELYWPSSVHTTDFTQVTLGALLLVRARLEGWRSPGLTESAAQMDAIRLKWRSAWETKARREVRARSELWKNYLAEIRESPAESARKYSYEVRLRVMLSLLLAELPAQSDEPLSALDAKLHAVWRPGTFVWDPALKWVFPQESFWFLYGMLGTQE